MNKYQTQDSFILDSNPSFSKKKNEITYEIMHAEKVVATVSSLGKNIYDIQKQELTRFTCQLLFFSVLSHNNHISSQTPLKKRPEPLLLAIFHRYILIYQFCNFLQPGCADSITPSQPHSHRSNDSPLAQGLPTSHLP